MLQTPLIQRTTRKVLLTEPGIALQVHCVEMLSRIKESIRFVGRLHSAPKSRAARSAPGLPAKAPALGLAERQAMRGLGSLGSRVGAGRAARQHNAHLGAAA
jgi:DNA-binding transcriptional LysR family regulator